MSLRTKVGGLALFEASPAASETAAFTLPGCGPSKTGFGGRDSVGAPKELLATLGGGDADPPPRSSTTGTAFEHTLQKACELERVALLRRGGAAAHPPPLGSLVGPCGDPAGSWC